MYEPIYHGKKQPVPHGAFETFGSPILHPVHAVVKGRSRVKVRGLYRSETLKAFLEIRLRNYPGIRSFSASVLTGNLLICYEDGQSNHEIFSLLSGIVAEYHEALSSNPNQASLAPRFSPNLEPRHRPHLPYDKRHDRISRHKLRLLVAQAHAQPENAWHLQEAAEVLSNFQVSPFQGLMEESAQTLLRRYGPNLLSESVPRSGFGIFLGQFKSLPVALLGLSAFISLAIGGIADALVILAVVGINAAIGYITESRAEMTIQSLKRLVRPSALVLREAKPREVGGEAVVPGDILILKPGCRVAADCRIIESYYLTIDESVLTGESLPVHKTSTVMSLADIPLADRVNMAYMGTLVTGGQGVGVVVATGNYTEIGHIQTLVGEAQAPETPMQRQLDHTGRQLALLTMGVSAGVFLIGLLRGYGFLQMLRSAISLAVAAVPEGLPPVATSVLALGIRDMGRHRVLIRRLDAVETFGAIQAICLDKTGTLTLNRMSVAMLHVGGRRVKPDEGVFLSGGDLIHPHHCGELLALLKVGVLCSESEFTIEKGAYLLRGSSTENALIYLAISAGIDPQRMRQGYPLLNISHRSEGRPFMNTAHMIAEDEESFIPSLDPGISPGTKLLTIKGSPPEVLALCRQYLLDGQIIPLSETDRLTIELENERMGSEGLRVLGMGFAFLEGNGNGADVVEGRGFTWIGLVAMADPLRPGVKEAIRIFHQAGIAPLMITGDQVPIAHSVGRELNLSRGLPLEIFDSAHLQGLDPELLSTFARRVHAFARVSPAQKLQIVQALQRAGLVVAMTGDGINDGPALKAADIGIAMGAAGTDVAREIADVVLEDDNLETMIVAIRQGRAVYDNIRKSIHFLLATNMSEVALMGSAITMGIGQPLNPMQLLWINLVSDIFPGLALAVEQPEPDVMARPPRDPQETIITNDRLYRMTFESLVIGAGALSAYGYGILRYGMGPQAGSIAFLSLVFGQLLHAFSCRSERVSAFEAKTLSPNPYLTLAVAGTFGLQILAIGIPGMRRLLGISPVTALDGMVIGGSALLPLMVNETTKKMLKEGTP